MTLPQYIDKINSRFKTGITTEHSFHGELNSLIDEYNITLWEPALCTSVWQSIYLVNKEIISTTKDKELKSNLETEQTELFNKVAKYDSIIALKLKQKKER